MSITLHSREVGNRAGVQSVFSEVDMNVEDMTAIQQMIALYSYTFDSGDAGGWANVFTTDGTWEFYATGAVEPSTRLAGHEELRAFCERQFGNRPPGLNSMHHQSGVYFEELTGDTARTRVMVIITSQLPQQAGQIYLTGTYYDRWQKTVSGWRLAHRVLRA